MKRNFLRAISCMVCLSLLISVMQMPISLALTSAKGLIPQGNVEQLLDQRTKALFSGATAAEIAKIDAAIEAAGGIFLSEEQAEEMGVAVDSVSDSISNSAVADMISNSAAMNKVNGSSAVQSASVQASSVPTVPQTTDKIKYVSTYGTYFDANHNPYNILKIIATPNSTDKSPLAVTFDGKKTYNKDYKAGALTLAKSTAVTAVSTAVGAIAKSSIPGLVITGIAAIAEAYGACNNSNDVYNVKVFQYNCAYTQTIVQTYVRDTRFSAAEFEIKLISAKITTSGNISSSFIEEKTMLPKAYSKPFNDLQLVPPHYDDTAYAVSYKCSDPLRPIYAVAFIDQFQLFGPGGDILKTEKISNFCY